MKTVDAQANIPESDPKYEDAYFALRFKLCLWCVKAKITFLHFLFVQSIEPNLQLLVNAKTSRQLSRKRTGTHLMFFTKL